jgi:hypothetical protein
MELYRGEKVNTDAKDGEEEDLLELDLGEEEAELASRFLAIAVFYSQKVIAHNICSQICRMHGAYQN